MTSTTTKMTTPKRNHPDELIIGLVSVSDRASQGVYEDKGIPSLTEWLASALTSPWRAETRLIQDDAATISAALVELVDAVGCDLVLTTGGTGPARRDVTPEATLAVATKPMPGFGEQMRQISLNFVPTAILSRQVAVIRETESHAALIINLPGQPKSIKETLEGLRDADGKPTVPGIFAAVPYCIDLIGGPYVETRSEIVAAFRPKSAIRPAKRADGALPPTSPDGKV
jgi:molybdopterin adenylyltransferase